MPNISSIIKNVRNIMRNEDQGISGDAQRLEQLKAQTEAVLSV